MRKYRSYLGTGSCRLLLQPVREQSDLVHWQKVLPAYRPFADENFSCSVDSMKDMPHIS